MRRRVRVKLERDRETTIRRFRADLEERLMLAGMTPCDREIIIEAWLDFLADNLPDDLEIWEGEIDLWT